MKKYIVDKTKIVGDVIFVVEGGRPEFGGTEIRLLKSIFADIFGFEVQELRRGEEEFIAHGNNHSSRIFALNLPKNQLTQVTEDSLDLLYSRLRKEFNIKPENCPMFLLYDRDYKSYKPNELRGKYIRKYVDPYSNENGDQGQLLLSYPSVESYILSCVVNDLYQQTYYLGTDIKPVTKTYGISEENISQEELVVHAVNEMDKGLAAFAIEDYDLDNLAPTLLNVYEMQQKKMLEENAFSALSLISMALLELGLIVECQDDDVNSGI